MWKPQEWDGRTTSILILEETGCEDEMWVERDFDRGLWC